VPKSCYLIFLVFFHCFRTFATGEKISNTKVGVNERVFTASKVYSLVQRYFVSTKEVPDPNWDASFRNYLRGVLASDDRREFDLATMEFVAQLRNGHTLFWDSWLDKNFGQPLGFYAGPLNGKWVIWTSSLPALKPGDVLDRVDDRTIEDFFRRQLRYISASSVAAQRHNLFLLPHLFPEQFTLTLGDGRKVVVDRTSVREPAMKTDGHWLKQGQMAYIRIPSFFQPMLEDKALNYLSQFRNARTLIIDVRNNPGGLSPTRLVRALMDRPYRGWRESTAVHIGLFESQRPGSHNGEPSALPDYLKGYADALGILGNSQLSWGSAFVAPGQPVFRGRLIILVDGGCVSACEDFVEPFKDNGRATLVGETTQGSSGLPYSYDFHNGMILRVAVKRDCFPDGTEFEGVGIKPDVEVHPSIESLKARQDVILDKALELAGTP
jgi:carboxyl-terminal processing protease